MGSLFLLVDMWSLPRENPDGQKMGVFELIYSQFHSIFCKME